MRFFVACSLRRCRTPDNEARLVDALIELTGDEDGDVRDYALFGLRELGVDSAVAYGLDAATALADPRLPPTLRALEQRLGDRRDLRQAILACTEGP